MVQPVVSSSLSSSPSSLVLSNNDTTCTDYDDAFYPNMMTLMENLRDRYVVVPVDIGSYCGCSFASGMVAEGDNFEGDTQEFIPEGVEEGASQSCGLVSICQDGMYVSEESIRKRIEWTWKWQRLNITLPPTTTCGALEQMAPYIAFENGNMDVCNAMTSHAPDCCTPFPPSPSSTAPASLPPLPSESVLRIDSEIMLRTENDVITEKEIQELKQAYMLMVEELHGTPIQREHRQLRPSRRLLDAVVDSDSIGLTMTLDSITCLGVADGGGGLCWVAYGFYNLRLIGVTFSDLKTIAEEYTRLTNDAIDDGMLAHLLLEIEPETPLTILLSRRTDGPSAYDDTVVRAPSSDENNVHRSLAIGFGITLAIIVVLAAGVCYVYLYLRRNNPCSDTESEGDAYLKNNDENNVRDGADEENEELSDATSNPEIPKSVVSAFKNLPDQQQLGSPKLSNSVIAAFEPSPVLDKKRSPTMIGTGTKMTSNFIEGLVSPKRAMDHPTSPSSPGGESITKNLFAQEELVVIDDHDDDDGDNPGRSVDCFAGGDSLNVSSTDYAVTNIDERGSQLPVTPTIMITKLHSSSRSQQSQGSMEERTGSLSSSDRRTSPTDSITSPPPHLQADEEIRNADPIIATTPPDRKKNDKALFIKTPISSAEESGSSNASSFSSNESCGDEILFETLASGSFRDDDDNTNTSNNMDWEGGCDKKSSISSLEDDLAKKLCFEGQTGLTGFPSP